MTILFGSLTVIGIIGLILTTPSGEYQYRFSRTVDASRKLTWDVVADVSNYSQYATNLHSVKVDRPGGIGQVRTCTDVNGSWQETCTGWEEMKSYSFLAHADAKDYPFPISYLKGTWNLTDVDGRGTRIDIEFTVKWKYRVIGWTLGEKAKEVFASSNKTVLDNWEKEILKRRDELLPSQ